MVAMTGALRDSSTSPLCFPEGGSSHLSTRHCPEKSRLWKEGGTTVLAGWRLSKCPLNKEVDIWEVEVG